MLGKPAVTALALGLIVSLAIGEVVLRVGYAKKIPALADPSLYARPFCDDRYHMLRLSNQDQWALKPLGYELDPLLGWAPSSGSRHAPQEDKLLDGDTRWVALFGDSFTAGTWEIEPGEYIVDQLDVLLPERAVVNYAVSGYGLDQIYLRFDQTLSRVVPRPDTAVVVVMVGDLDRVIERIRDAPKPYYRIDAGQLKLHGVPLTQATEEWIDQNTSSKRSWLLDLIATTIARSFEGREGFFSECRRDEKEAIASQLIGAFQARASARGVDLLFVVYHPSWDYDWDGWRTAFLHNEFEARGLEYIDLNDFHGRHVGDPADLYYPAPNGHPTPAGNTLAADAIAEKLEGRVSAPEYDFGSTIQFGIEGNVGPYLATGWHRPESDLNWTRKSVASLYLDPPPHQGPLRVHLEIAWVFAIRDDDRTLEIRLNGISSHSRPMASLEHGQKLELAFTDDAVLARPLHLEIDSSRVLIPSEVSWRNDTRPLGISIRSLTVSRALDSERPASP